MSDSATTDQRIYCVGLTGGIASGKTSVTDLFASHGVPVVDADVLAREVVAAGSPTLSALGALFAQSILTASGELDRKKLRELIFADANIRKQVESVLHPAIRELSTRRVEQHAAAGADYVICSVPLLVETAQTGRYDRIVVVDVSPETQIQRLMQRDNTSREDAMKILQSQASRAERLAVADDIIDNSGTLSALAARVGQLHRQYLVLSASPPAPAND